MIDFHTHSNQQEDDILKIRSVHQKEFSELNRFPSCSIGLHPWYITKDNAQNHLDCLEENLGNENVLALGECGLDRLRGETLDFQEQIFEKQLELADHFQKPVIIHCVRAFQELVKSVKKVRPNVPIIIHGFNKKERIFDDLEKEGFYFSFGAHILNKQSPAYQIIQKINSNRFFLETDDKEISIKKVYEQASFLRNTKLSNTLAQILENLQNIGIHV